MISNRIYRLSAGPSTASSTSSFWASLVTAGVAIVLGLALTACEPSPDVLSTVMDLVDEAAFAEAFVDPARIDVGTPAGRGYLGGGWSTRDEQDGHGRFVWAVGESSVIDVPILERRDLRIELELRPFTWPGSPPQGLKILVGDMELASFELSPGPSVVAFDLPEGAQQGDGIRLTLRWAWHRSPSEVLGVADRRSLTAAAKDRR